MFARLPRDEHCCSTREQPCHHCITLQRDHLIYNVGNEEVKRGFGVYCIDPSEAVAPYFVMNSRAGSMIKFPPWFEWTRAFVCWPGCCLNLSAGWTHPSLFRACPAKGRMSTSSIFLVEPSSRSIRMSVSFLRTISLLITKKAEMWRSINVSSNGTAVCRSSHGKTSSQTICLPN